MTESINSHCVTSTWKILSPGKKKHQPNKISLSYRNPFVDSLMALSSCPSASERSTDYDKGVQDLPVPTKEAVKDWMQTIKDQEHAITHNRRNAQESGHSHRW